MQIEKTRRLHTLTSCLCDGEISAEQLHELSVLLDNDQEAIHEYLDFTSLHLNLEQKLRSIRTVDDFSDDLAENLTSDANVAKVARLSQEPRTKSLRGAAILAIAASILVAFYLIQTFQSSPSYTARIVQKIDCDWDEERWGAPQSALLEAGREIKLDRGLMILEFGEGAEVTLEAPIHFTVLTQDRGNLSFGKLSAFVPEQAQGFTIQVPTGEIVDLGTQFGVLVDEAGNCEAHVFQGNVLVRTDLGEIGQPSKEWEVASDKAIRILAGTQEVKHLSSKNSMFASYSRFNSVDIEGKRSSLSIPDDSNLVLWLDSAKELQLDSDNRVLAWGDLSSDAYSSKHNAWQVDVSQRPLWVKEAIAGKPGVRFNGSSSLITTPFLSGDELTIFWVQQVPQEKSIRRFGSFLSNTTTPSLNLVITKNQQLAAVLSTRRSISKNQQTILLEDPLPNEDVPTVFALTYSNTANRAAFYINGNLTSESHAPSISRAQTPKIIGFSDQQNSGFVGDLGELIIFNTALSANHCIQLSNELMEKYGITATQREPRVLSGLVPEENK